jgi:hypothetical protein
LAEEVAEQRQLVQAAAWPEPVQVQQGQLLRVQVPLSALSQEPLAEPVREPEAERAVQRRVPEPGLQLERAG